MNIAQSLHNAYFNNLIIQEKSDLHNTENSSRFYTVKLSLCTYVCTTYNKTLFHIKHSDLYKLSFMENLLPL